MPSVETRLAGQAAKGAHFIEEMGCAVTFLKDHETRVVILEVHSTRIQKPFEVDPELSAFPKTLNAKWNTARRY